MAYRIHIHFGFQVNCHFCIIFDVDCTYTKNKTNYSMNRYINHTQRHMYIMLIV